MPGALALRSPGKRSEGGAAVYLSLGSNIDPEANVMAAVRELGREVRITGISTVYRTKALGGSQPDYYNCVLRAETALQPEELKFGLLRRIEQCLGRERGEDRYAPRTIDIDILIYGSAVVDGLGLTVPDPDILERPFLAAGLLELDPLIVLPGRGRSLAEECQSMDMGGMEALRSFTERVRLAAGFSSRGAHSV